MPAARMALTNDRWKIYVEDPNRGVIVTEWKQIHHALVWLFMGKVYGRCTVHLTRLDAHRTRVVFQGDLASHRDLTHNPLSGAARKAYTSAARKWHSEVRENLAMEHRARQP